MTASVPGARVTDRDAGLLRDRDLRLLLAGQAASELGSQVGGSPCRWSPCSGSGPVRCRSGR